MPINVKNPGQSPYLPWKSLKASNRHPSRTETGVRYVLEGCVRKEYNNVFLNGIRSEKRFKTFLEQVKYEWENFKI